jgi:hypothetical protein
MFWVHIVHHWWVGDKQKVLTCDAISRDWHKREKKKHIKYSLNNDWTIHTGSNQQQGQIWHFSSNHVLIYDKLLKTNLGRV